MTKAQVKKLASNSSDEDEENKEELESGQIRPCNPDSASLVNSDMD